MCKRAVKTDVAIVTIELASKTLTYRAQFLAMATEKHRSLIEFGPVSEQEQLFLLAKGFFRAAAQDIRYFQVVLEQTIDSVSMCTHVQYIIYVGTYFAITSKWLNIGNLL